MTDFLLQVAGETWSIFKEASLFLLVGFAVAGVLAVLVPSRLFRRLVEVVLRQDADAVLLNPA